MIPPQPLLPPNVIMTRLRHTSRRLVGLESSRRWRRLLGAAEGRSEAGLGSEYDDALSAAGVCAAR